MLIVLLLGLGPCLAGRALGEATQQPKSVLAGSAMDDLPARMQAVATAQQSGDVVKIASANRDLIAVALRAMAEVKLAQGDTKQAIDLYKQSLEFENTPNARIALALACMRAQRTDDALAEIAQVTKTDANNADAWNVQGKLLMDKKEWRPAAEALTRSLELQSNVIVAYALATAYLNLRENNKAEVIFKQLTDATGDRASLHIMIGRAYQNAGMMDEAVREFNRAAAIDAKSSRAHYFIGLLYMAQNEWVATPQAREQFTEEIQVNPRDFFGNFFLGYIDNVDKLYDDSDRYLKVAALDKPDWPEPYLYMGLNAFARKDNQIAEEMLRKAIELTGDDKARNNYQIRRAYYVLGRICYQSGRKDEASTYTKIFSDMQEKTMEDSRANTPASKVQGTMGSGMAAEPSVPTSAMIDPTAQPGDVAPQLSAQEKAALKTTEQRLSELLGNAYNDLGTSDARQKDYSSALKYFQQAEKWNPAIAHLMRNVGFAAFRSSDYPESARALKVAIQQEPGDRIIPPMLAMALFSSDQYAEAVKVFDQVGDVAYSDPRVAYAWATSLARTHQPEKAAAVLARMSQQLLAPDALLLVGQVYSEIGNAQQALAAFQKALQENPSLQRAHYYAGLAQLRLKQPSAAIAEFEAELKLNPNDADTQYQLGKALLDEGKPKDAILHLQSAAKLNPDLDAVHNQLQIAYRKTGRAADADREAKLAEDAKTKPTAKSAPD
ncbi:MAG TPA: tetratricopeptide repeat protein [Candidatus Eisenbacteria bacterium]|nr:tetratricopeptide repeat protein [Candidatus Eisenbacteria bacterium]